MVEIDYWLDCLVQEHSDRMIKKVERHFTLLFSFAFIEITNLRKHGPYA